MGWFREDTDGEFPWDGDFREDARGGFKNVRVFSKMRVWGGRSQEPGARSQKGEGVVSGQWSECRKEEEGRGVRMGSLRVFGERVVL